MISNGDSNLNSSLTVAERSYLFLDGHSRSMILEGTRLHLPWDASL